jgi:protein phosphatase
MTAPSPAPRKPIVVHVFGRTDVGRTRDHNEDAFVVADLSNDRATLQPEVRTHEVGDAGTLFMVADGMGGAAAGELASQMATDVVLEEIRNNWAGGPRRDAEAFASSIRAAAESANAHIHEYATKHPENRGMGSTATIAGLLGDTLYLAQIGDSRGYLVRGGIARQITKDQSLVQRLVEAGELTAEEAEQSERRNIILQALGPDAAVKIDLTNQQIRQGDILVLCSDGLSGQVRTEDIGKAIAEEADLVAACKRLIDMANEAGGPDNITVVAARFEGEGLEPPSGDDDVGYHVFQLHSESRDTVPVPVVVDEDDTPTLPTGDVPADLAPPAVQSTAQAAESSTPTPRGPSVGTLRLLFAFILVLVAGGFIVAWLM